MKHFKNNSAIKNDNYWNRIILISLRGAFLCNFSLAITGKITQHKQTIAKDTVQYALRLNEDKYFIERKCNTHSSYKLTCTCTCRFSVVEFHHSKYVYKRCLKIQNTSDSTNTPNTHEEALSDLTSDYNHFPSLFSML